MARCKGCGKKGLFLKLNARGLCEECAEKAKAVPKSGQIVFTTDGGVNGGAEFTDLGHEEEENACQYFINQLVMRGKEESLFKIEHRTPEYTSLVYDEYNDFIRIKITKNVSWISLSLSAEDQQRYMNSPLFEGQEKKSVRHWRSYFESVDDLHQYLNMAENACTNTLVGTVRDMSEREKVIADYLYDLFLKCGAEPENMYYCTYAHECELLYKYGSGGIRFKAYAKKQGGSIDLDPIFDEVGLKADKQRLPFVELSELDCFTEKLIPAKIQKGNEMAKYNHGLYRRYMK